MKPFLASAAAGLFVTAVALAQPASGGGTPLARNSAGDAPASP